MAITRRTLMGGYVVANAVPSAFSARAQNIADVASLGQSIQALEHQADALGLAASSIRRRGPAPHLSSSNFYLDGLPRLVDVQDRGNSVPSGADLARQAGEQLSVLNALERTTPAALLPLARGRPKPTFASLESSYNQLLRTCITAPKFRDNIAWYLRVILEYRPHYEDVSTKTSVPWYFIGIIHSLEASFNLYGHLHNGDPLSAKTVHVPKGRPVPWLPPSDWVSSAVDALTFEGFAAQTTWDAPHILYHLESYNGFGYRDHRVNSPYLWSFSNHYTGGKFDSDGHWSASAVSQQCGGAVLLKELNNIRAIT